jgi:hypothetical protein
MNHLTSRKDAVLIPLYFRGQCLLCTLKTVESYASFFGVETLHGCPA